MVITSKDLAGSAAMPRSSGLEHSAAMPRSGGLEHSAAMPRSSGLENSAAMPRRCAERLAFPGQRTSLMERLRRRYPTCYGPLAVIILLAMFLSACKWSQPEDGRHFDLTGKVIEVDRQTRQVTVAHEAIPGYMDAMTMPFGLKDEWAYAVLKPGDKISGVLVVAEHRSWLQDVTISEETPDPNAPVLEGAVTVAKPGDAVPDFSLVNQDGKPIHLAQYRGRAIVLTFIYTRCPMPDYCPLMSLNFSEINKSLKEKPDLFARTLLLSVSIDPAYDKGAVLKDYGSGYLGEATDEAFKHWEFAGGSMDQVKQIAEFFGLRYWQDNNQIIHSLRTAIIGPDGKVVKVYNGNEWKPAEIVSELTNFAPKS